mmetsp:Transcript_111993/g.321830  ORF Transcript_111993/g.321830 Transcript_111993/m.321830 type:complete len:80 (-) Transcript_111993:54-293(-)
MRASATADGFNPGATKVAIVNPGLAFAAFAVVFKIQPPFSFSPLDTDWGIANGAPPADHVLWANIAARQPSAMGAGRNG